MRINVESERVTENSGTSAKNGKAYTIRKQAAYAAMIDDDGVVCKSRVEIQLDRDQPPYKIGQYVLDDRSFGLGNFGSLKINNIVLQPVAAATQPKAA